MKAQECEGVGGVGQRLRRLGDDIERIQRRDEGAEPAAIDITSGGEIVECLMVGAKSDDDTGEFLGGSDGGGGGRDLRSKPKGFVAGKLELRWGLRGGIRRLWGQSAGKIQCRQAPAQWEARNGQSAATFDSSAQTQRGAGVGSGKDEEDAVGGSGYGLFAKPDGTVGAQMVPDGLKARLTQIGGMEDRWAAIVDVDGADVEGRGPSNKGRDRSDSFHGLGSS